MTQIDPLPIETDCAAAQQALGQASCLLLDCREQDEYKLARIAGATLLPMSEIQERIADLEPHRDRHVIVYCHHGVRSLHVAYWLRQQGFSNVQSMAGGIDAWSQILDPTVPRY
jgi:rhodanese-related sulfurtransferase